MRQRRNIVGNPHKRKFRVGFVNIVGEITLIDIAIVLVSMIFAFISIFLIESIFIKIMVGIVIIPLITIIFITEYNGIKPYEIIWEFTWKKSLQGKYLDLENKSSDKEVIFSVGEGYNLSILNQEERENLLMLFELAINITNEFKIIKTTNVINIDSIKRNISKLYFEIEDLKKRYNKTNKFFLLNKTQILAEHNALLDELVISGKTSNLFIVFKNRKAAENASSNFGFLKLKEIKNKTQKDIWKDLFLQNKEKKNTLQEVKKREIISGKKRYALIEPQFKGELDSYWLLDMFVDEKINFIFDIQTPNYKDLKQFKRKLERQHSKRKRNPIEEIKRLEEEDKNKEIYASIVLDDAALKNFSLLLVVELEDENQRNQLFKLNEILSQTKMKYSRVWVSLAETFSNYLSWNSPKIRYPTTNWVISESFMFVNQTILDEKGLYLGDAMGQPLVFDPFKFDENRTNLHQFILGQSGSGKTYLLKNLLATEISVADTQHIVLDPLDQFSDLAINVGGKIFDLSEEKIGLNPLKLHRVKKDNFEASVNTHLDFLGSFFEKFIQTEGAQWILNKILEILKEFYLKNKTKILAGKEFIFTDLVKFTSNKFSKSLQQDEQRALDVLKTFSEGVNNSLNKKEDIVFDKHMTVFNIGSITRNKTPLSFSKLSLLVYKITNLIYDQPIKDRKSSDRKYISIYMDEAGRILREPVLRKLVSGWFSEARNLGTKLTFATQNISDIYQPKEEDTHLQNIISNTNNIWIGKLDMTQLELLDKLLTQSTGRKLTQRERDNISQSIPGRFLIILNTTKRILVQSIEGTPKLKQILGQVMQRGENDE